MLVTGAIEFHGAVIGTLIGVSRERRAALLRVGHPVPAQVPLYLQIDTGSFATVLPRETFAALDLTRILQVPLRTAFTAPGPPIIADQFDVSVTLVSGMSQFTLPSVFALASHDFRTDQPLNGVIGRDILRRCVFQYVGTEQKFSLAF